MVKSKRNIRKHHIQKIIGRRFTNPVRNLNLEKVSVIPTPQGEKRRG